MGQVLNTDSVAKSLNSPVVLSPTAVQLSGENLITIGGQQYILSNKIMDGTTTGLGGLDTGSLANDLTYNLFAVSDAGVQGLVGSTALTPVGYAAYTLIGTFTTDGSAQIIAAAGLGAVGGGGGTLQQEVFTTSGTFNVPAGVTEVFAWGCGGGGGGGGGASASNTVGRPGGGGGGGAVILLESFLVTPGDAMAVVIGPGGTSGVGGNFFVNGTPGGTGGTTTFAGFSWPGAPGGSGGIADGAVNTAGAPLVQNQYGWFTAGGHAAGGESTGTYISGLGGASRYAAGGTAGSGPGGWGGVGGAGGASIGPGANAPVWSNAGPGVSAAVNSGAGGSGGSGADASQAFTSIGGVGGSGYLRISWVG